MKPTSNFTTGAIALSLSLGLVQWSRAQADHDVAARQQPPVLPANVSSQTSQVEPVEKALRGLLAAGGSSPVSTSDKRWQIVSLSRQLSPDPLKKVLQSIEGDTTITEEVKSEILVDYSYARRRDALQIALELLQEDDTTSNRGALGSVVREWAEDEPIAALDWLRNLSYPISGEVLFGMRRDAYIQQVLVDPKSALKSILDDDLIANEETGRELGRKLMEPRKLKAFFKAVNGLSSSSLMAECLAPLRMGVAHSLSYRFQNHSFKDTIALFHECLNADDKITLAAACIENKCVPDPIEWANWLATFEQPVALQDSARIRQAAIVTWIQYWGMMNPKDAAIWLGTMPEGPAKQDCLVAYAEGLRKRDPALAAKWAMELPPGDLRNTIVWKLVGVLEKKDPVTAKSLCQSLSSIR